MIIDTHTHIFPDKLAKGALIGLSASSNIKPFTDGTLKGTLKRMKSWKIDKFIIQNIAVTPKTQNNVNTFAIQTNGENYLSFGSVHPNSDDAISEIERLFKGGVRGIKLHCEYQNFYPDDDRAIKIYKACRDYGLAIMFHGGADVGFKPPFKATPKRLLNAYKKVPYSKYIVAHMGGFEMYDDAIKYLADTKINIETSFAITRMSKDLAHKVIDALGVDRVMFGSDLPWESPLLTVKAVQALKYTDAEKQLIFEKNARSLLGI